MLEAGTRVTWVQGTESGLSDPEVVPKVFALILMYFLVRFAQYAYDIENKGFVDRFVKRESASLSYRLLAREFEKPDSWVRSHYAERRELKVENFLAFHEHVKPWHVEMDITRPEKGGQVLERRVAFRWFELIVPFFVGACYVVVRTRLVTDFVLSILLFAFAACSLIDSV